MKWKVEYDSDSSYEGEGAFWEWWQVTDGVTVFKTDYEEQANELCDILNKNQLNNRCECQEYDPVDVKLCSNCNGYCE
jgi:hypothetical protein